MTHRSRRRVQQHLDQVFRLIGSITTWGGLMAADLAALTAEVAKLRQAVIDDEAADDKNEADLNAIIADLKAKGTPDMQPTIDAIEEVIGNLHAPIVPPAP